MTKWYGTTNDNMLPGGSSSIISSVSHTATECASNIVYNLNFPQVLESHVTCSLSEFNKLSTTVSFKTKARQPIDYVTISNLWNIYKDRARQNNYKTTQRGVRTVLHPYLSRRYPTNDRGLRYDQTNHPLFTDTFIAGTTYKRGNKYAQVYGTSFGWARAHPMKLKSEGHKTLYMLFKRHGVPPEMVMDRSKEQNLGKFHQKLKDAGCYKHQTDPYFPCLNAAEVTIIETKKGSSRKVIKTGTPKCLWDHYLELEALIRSNTALDYHILDGEVPEMLMTRQADDISHICEYSWFDWVMFF